MQDSSYLTKHMPHTAGSLGVGKAGESSNSFYTRNTRQSVNNVFVDVSH